MNAAPSDRVSRVAACVLSATFLLLHGCHSAYVNATVENHTGGPISPLEVDYPSASFGTESVRNGGNYAYRFKILGSGPTKAVWTDASHHEHTAPGPSLHEGQEGSLRVELTPNGVRWTPQLTP